MSPQWLDAHTARTPVNNLTGMGGDLLDVLLGGVAERHGARIGEHGGGVRGQREKSEHLEYARIEKVGDGERRRQYDHEHDHKLGEEDERPGGRGAHNAACVAHEPGGAAARRPRTLDAVAVAAVLLVVGGLLLFFFFVGVATVSSSAVHVSAVSVFTVAAAVRRMILDLLVVVLFGVRTLIVQLKSAEIVGLTPAI